MVDDFEENPFEGMSDEDIEQIVEEAFDSYKTAVQKPCAPDEASLRAQGLSEKDIQFVLKIRREGEKLSKQREDGEVSRECK